MRLACLLPTLEVPSLYLGPVIGYPKTFRGFPNSLQKNAKKVPQIGSRPPLPTSLPKSDCQNVSVRPFALPTNFTFHFAFSISLFIFHCLCCVLHLQIAQEHIDGRTDARLWLTFTSQNNALDNKLPRRRVSSPRPMATCVKYVTYTLQKWQNN